MSTATFTLFCSGLNSRIGKIRELPLISRRSSVQAILAIVLDPILRPPGQLEEAWTSNFTGTSLFVQFRLITFLQGSTTTASTMPDSDSVWCGVSTNLGTKSRRGTIHNGSSLFFLRP